MARGPNTKVPFRRRRKHKTDYRHRKSLLMSDMPRAVVRCSTRNTVVQFARFEPKGDVILATANTKELKELGWSKATGNTTAAYLAGYLAGMRAKKTSPKAVLDIGLHSPTRGSKVFAALKGMLDAGIDIPHDESILPSEDRIKGSHIGDDAPKMFDTVLEKIIKEGS
jgi:large subunit ribosomal protein L18